MGKTAVFVLACLQLVETTSADVKAEGAEEKVKVLVLCHARELAYQIQHEFMRFSKHLPEVKSMAVYGGSPLENDREALKKAPPHILVGTPGRVLALSREKEKALKLDGLTHFVLD